MKKLLLSFLLAAFGLVIVVGIGLAGTATVKGKIIKGGSGFNTIILNVLGSSSNAFDFSAKSIQETLTSASYVLPDNTFGDAIPFYYPDIKDIKFRVTFVNVNDTAKTITYGIVNKAYKDGLVSGSTVTMPDLTPTVYSAKESTSKPLAWVHGYVKDVETDEPINNCLVKIVANDAAKTTASVYTDGSGYYQKLIQFPVEDRGKSIKIQVSANTAVAYVYSFMYESVPNNLEATERTIDFSWSPVADVSLDSSSHHLLLKKTPLAGLKTAYVTGRITKANVAVPFAKVTVGTKKVVANMLGVYFCTVAASANGYEVATSGDYVLGTTLVKKSTGAVAAKAVVGVDINVP